MSNEKFSWDVIDHDVIFYENDAVIDYDDVVDLLNEQDADNKQLRILVESLKTENKKLKGRLNDLGVEYYQVRLMNIKCSKDHHLRIDVKNCPDYDEMDNVIHFMF